MCPVNLRAVSDIIGMYDYDAVSSYHVARNPRTAPSGSKGAYGGPKRSSKCGG